MSTTYGPIAPNLVKSGLILDLDANNLDSYPGSGTIWYDMSGMNANATIGNFPTFTNNNFSYFQFNGTSNYMDSVNITQEYRDLFVVLWSQQINGLEMLFSGYGGVDKSLRLATDVFRSSAGGTDANDWNYLNDTDMFGDGVFGSSVTCSGGWHIIRSYRSNDSFGTSFRYSISSTFLSRYFTGKLAYVCCYNRKLTQTEVLQNYKSLKYYLNI